jgi:predicted transcriptional regulator
MDFVNQNDRKLHAYLKRHGRCRLYELQNNAGVPAANAYARLLIMESRGIVKVEREPKSKGGISLKTVYFLPAGEDQQ